MVYKIALLHGHASYDVLKTTERYFSIKIISYFSLWQSLRRNGIFACAITRRIAPSDYDLQILSAAMAPSEHAVTI